MFPVGCLSYSGGFYLADVTSQSIVNAVHTLSRMAPSLSQSRVRVCISTQQMRNLGPAGATMPAVQSEKSGAACSVVRFRVDLSSHEWIPWDLSFGGGLLEALGKQSALETELVVVLTL